MARPLRVQFPGAVYHVIARGNARQDIFFDDNDRKKFLDCLKDIIKTHNLVCYAYCLLDDHYHLLLETIDANLSEAMRDLNGIYSQKFNLRHNRVGHLFQGRYKAFLIEKDAYLLEVARYIVLNPVRAGIVKSPRYWRWSSYNATVGISKAPEWLNTNGLLGTFSNKKRKAQTEYKRFVSDGLEHDPYKDLQNNFILGTPQFVRWIWDKTNGSEDVKDYQREQRVVGRPTIEEIFRDVTNLKERDDAIVFAKIRCGYLNTEIARHLNLSNSTVGKIVCGKYNVK